MAYRPTCLLGFCRLSCVRSFFSESVLQIVPRKYKPRSLPLSPNYYQKLNQSNFWRNFSSGNEAGEILEPDELYSQVQLMIKGQDKEVINSYVTFLKMTCHHLG